MLRVDKVALLERFGCRIITSCSPAALLEFGATAKRTIEFDFETINKRPYGKGAAIQSIAVSDGKQTLLSRPQIRFIEGRPASVMVGQEVPVLFKRDKTSTIEYFPAGLARGPGLP